MIGRCDMRLDIQPAGTDLDAWSVPYPFVIVPGASALAALRSLERDHPGRSAVIWGDRSEAERLFEPWGRRTEEEIADRVRAALQRSGGRGVDLLEHYLTDVEKALAKSHGARSREIADLDEDPPPVEADGPLPLPYNGSIGLIDHRTGEIKPEVMIGLLPTARPFEAMAYHGFGGWNACPPPGVHVALGRDWYDRYGARLIVNTNDVIEYEIERPIATREEALEIAWVHYRYCTDTVAELVGSIEALAATLRGGRYWYFWWH